MPTTVMIKNILNIFFALNLALLSLSSCRERVVESGKSEHTVKLSTPNVPSVLSDEKSRMVYLVKHYWDSINFQDSSYLEREEDLERFFVQYLSLLNRVSTDISHSSFLEFCRAAIDANSLFRDKILELTDKMLYHPNSPVRDEELYILLLKTTTQSNSIPEYVKEKLYAQLSLAQKNRPGERAENFNYITTKGESGTLFSINAPYTVLMFYEPECHSCESAIEYLNRELDKFDLENRVYFISVYTGDDVNLWYKSSKKFPHYWSVAKDIDMQIAYGKLYDRRASPSIYLLDKRKTVILKDAMPDVTVQRLVHLLRGTTHNL